MSARMLEVAANSLASARAAQAGGAARVELCSALELGGITPSYGMLALAREQLDIGIHVLIRPRGGDFIYHDAEVETMHRDIEACADLGCDGVVMGALDARGSVDMDVCRALLDAAGTLDVTFHRAFDLVDDTSAALEDVIALGCSRVLTSGGAVDAAAGSEQLRKLVRQAGPRLAIMPGAGIHSGNIAGIAEHTGAREFHASAKRALPSRFADCAGFPDMQGGETRTDRGEVHAMVEALRCTRRSPETLDG